MSEDKLLKLNTVLEYVQISKSKIYEMMSEGEFPKPQKIGGNTLWLMSDIQDYIRNIKKQAS